MRVLPFVALTVLVVACNRGGDDATPETPALDPSQLQNASGEVSLADGGEMGYQITSERYKQWYAAQQSLDHATAARFGTILHPNSPSAASIDQATAYLERTPRAKAGIERSGMSVRDFVQMTVALQQQFRDAAQAGAGAGQDLPYYVPPPLDTALPPPPVSTAPMPNDVQPSFTPSPSYTPPQVYTPMPQVDTIARPQRRDSTPDSTRLTPKPARPSAVAPAPTFPADTSKKPDTTSTPVRDSLSRR